MSSLKIKITSKNVREKPTNTLIIQLWGSNWMFGHLLHNSCVSQNGIEKLLIYTSQVFQI
jgi:hypothetical protein